MEQNIIDLKRRNILKQSLFGLSAIVAATMVTPSAYASDLPEVTEDDPTAMALGYKKDTTTVDAAAQPKHTAEQNCSNCTLYASNSDTLGGCTIFPGKQVNAAGWCSAYIKKA